MGDRMKITKDLAASRVAQARKIRGLTQEQLALILNKDKQTVWRWENSERGMTRHTIERIARCLDFDVLFLLGYSDNENVPYKWKEQDLIIGRENTGTRIAICRKNAGMSVEDLASALNMTPFDVYMIEASHTWPNPDVLKSIAIALEVDQDILISKEPLVLKPSQQDQTKREIESSNIERTVDLEDSHRSVGVEKEPIPSDEEKMTFEYKRRDESVTLSFPMSTPDEVMERKIDVALRVAFHERPSDRSSGPAHDYVVNGDTVGS